MNKVKATVLAYVMGLCECCRDPGSKANNTPLSSTP